MSSELIPGTYLSPIYTPCGTKLDPKILKERMFHIGEPDARGHYTLREDWFTVKKGSILEVWGCIDGETVGPLEIEALEDISVEYKGSYTKRPRINPIDLEKTREACLQEYQNSSQDRLSRALDECNKAQEIYQNKLSEITAKIAELQKLQNI